MILRFYLQDKDIPEDSAAGVHNVVLFGPDKLPKLNPLTVLTAKEVHQRFKKEFGVDETVAMSPLVAVILTAAGITFHTAY